MVKIKPGMFCKVYGSGLRNRVLEYMLEFGELDFAAGDIAKEIGISRPKTYQIIAELELQKIIKKSRVVSGTQLYVLNDELLQVKLLKRSFRECLKLVLEEEMVKQQSAEPVKARKEMRKEIVV